MAIGYWLLAISAYCFYRKKPFFVQTDTDLKIMLIFASKSMAMEEKVINEIKQTLLLNLPSGGHALLYGSRARGDAHAGSDWDILIILDKEKLLPEDYDSVSYPLRELGWEIGESINPVMYTAKEWQDNSFTPFYHNVIDDAIPLA